MRKVVKLATAALALVGAWKVASWMCEGTAWLLVNRGFWEPQAAAESAPWILFALAAGLACLCTECMRTASGTSAAAPMAAFSTASAATTAAERRAKT